VGYLEIMNIIHLSRSVPASSRSKVLQTWILSLLATLPLLSLAQVVPVPTAKVQSLGFAQTYTLDGFIQPVKQSTVSAQAAGRIVALHVKAGDWVKLGQLLAVVDGRETAVGVQKSQAQMQQAEAEMQNAQANYERVRDLQSKGFVSKAALDIAHTQLKAGQAGRDLAQASVRQSGLAQGYTRLTAPYDGWILQTHLQSGDLASPGVPVVTLYAPQPLRAVVQVPGSRLNSVQMAAQTDVLIDGVSGDSRVIKPAARQAVPSADPISQTTEWRFELPAKDSVNLVPGQQVRVRFSEPQSGGATALWMPASAVVRRGELTAVYIAVSGGFSLRAIRLGSKVVGNSLEVLAGVVAGDEVALDPVKAGARTAGGAR
jgi:RND family efflux transporter MFP subunit